MDLSTFKSRCSLDFVAIEDWIAEGWLRPTGEGADYIFGEIDVARVMLVKDLRNGLGMNDEGISIVLDLIDQIHGLRAALCHATDLRDRRLELVRVGVQEDGDDPVNEASEESFPASDPPSWNTSRIGKPASAPRGTNYSGPGTRS
jgi:chaperone modulatory protein CbpM